MPHRQKTVERVFWHFELESMLLTWRRGTSCISHSRQTCCLAPFGAYGPWLCFAGQAALAVGYRHRL